MTTISQASMTNYARMAGFTNPALMGAIGMAESSGRTDVVNSIGCVGPWQVNQPVWVKSHPSWTVAYLKDPYNNAKAAKVIFDAQGYGAWEAYTNGAYKQYYSGSTASTGASTTASQAGLFDDLTGAGAVSSAIDAGASIANIGGEIASTATWFADPKNILRIFYVGAGTALLLVGTAIVLRGTSVGKAASSINKAGKNAALSFVPGGSAVKGGLSKALKHGPVTTKSTPNRNAT